VYRASTESLDAGRPLRGALFWEWNTDGQRRGRRQGERAVNTGDTAWRYVDQFACHAGVVSLKSKTHLTERVTVAT
jgi:hypothetical protein